MNSGFKTSNLTKNNNQGPTQEPLETGSYPARLVSVNLLGVQTQRPYQGQEKPPVQEINLTYELSDEFMKDEEGNEIEDKPRWVSETIPLHSLNSDRAKSTGRYLALDPTVSHEGDWSMLIGTPCNVQLVRNPSKKDPTRIYNNVKQISSMRTKDADKLPELKNEPRLFSPYTEDVDGFRALPEWMQDKIKGAVDFDDTPLSQALTGSHKGEVESSGDTPPKHVNTPSTDDSEDGGDW